MDDLEYAVDELVERIRRESGSRVPARLRATYFDFLRTVDPLALPPEWRNGYDVLGETYMRLLSPEERRPVGQVFTPSWAARIMTKWTVQKGSRLLLDPGCGSGVLLQAAGSLNPARLALHGFDVDPVAVEMARVNCAMRGLPAQIEQLDFLLGQTGLTPDSVVANPPYTRHHELDRETKDAICDGVGARLHLKHTRQASLHALFLARAVEIAAEGARIAFVTPSQWLSTTYGREVREYVESLARIDAVLELPYDFFPNAKTSASITFVTKGEDTVLPKQRSLGRALPTIDDVLAWLDCQTKPSVAPMRVEPRMVPLGQLATVSRGTATGYNHFFVLSEAERVERQIPMKHVRRCITTPRAVATSVLREEDFEAMGPHSRRWLLCVERDESDPRVLDYLAHGETLGASERYLCSRRGTWYEIKCRGEYPILFSYLNKQRPRVVKNEANAVPLNTWLVVTPREGVDPGRLVSVLSSEYVAEAARRASRHYGHGLWKLEPSELEQLSVPWEG